MLCPPSRGLVAPRPPLSPHTCAFVGWCVRGLAFLVYQLVSQLVSELAPACLPACPPACLPACLPTCPSSSFPLLDGTISPFSPTLSKLVSWLVSQLVSYLALSPSLSPILSLACLPASFLFPFVGRCVGLPEVLLSLVSPTFPPLLALSPLFVSLVSRLIS